MRAYPLVSEFSVILMDTSLVRPPAGVAPQRFERRPGAAALPLPANYRRRTPEDSVLHEVVREHLNDYLARARDRDEHGAGLPRFIARGFERYLACGILAQGFARVRCQDCGRNERLVAFSCKTRGLCPSCNARRMHDTAAHLVDRVLPRRAPYRQWVLSLPRRLRYLLAFRGRLAGRVLTEFLRAVFHWQRRLARRYRIPRPRPGSVTFVHRFGKALNLNVHYHCLVPDGVFAPTPDGAARFHLLPPPSDADVAEILVKSAARIRRLLEREGLEDADDRTPPALQGDLAASMERHLPAVEWLEDSEPKAPPRCAAFEGYSLHANVHVELNDREGLERLCRYGARPTFALERLERLPDSSLLCRFGRPMPGGQTSIRFQPLELLGRLAVLIPPPGFHTTRYHGVFAPNHPLRRKLVPTQAADAPRIEAGCPCRVARQPPPAAPAPRLRPLAGASFTFTGDGRAIRPRRLDWAALLRRVFKLDVLRCERCGGRMEVIAFLTDPVVVRQILRHLKLPDEPPPLAPARRARQSDLEFVDADPTDAI